MSSPLAGALGVAAESGGMQRRIGTVSALNPLTVTIANGTQLAITGRLSSYYPIINHNVLVLVDDSGAAIVAGKLSIANSGWTYPALQSGWTQRGGGFVNMRYRLLENMNAVWLHGEVTPPAAPSGTLLFTLPAGLRPKYSQGFSIPSRWPPGGTPGPLPVCEITPDGNVKAWDLASGGPVVINGFVALD